VRTYFEPRFGVDFGQVRVHSDAEAARMNRELNAQAFTHRQDVFFGAGRYSPESSEGKRLLAHELTHVVQQSYSVGAAGPQVKFEVSHPRDTAEREADEITTSIFKSSSTPSSRDFVRSSALLQRQEESTTASNPEVANPFSPQYVDNFESVIYDVSYRQVLGKNISKWLRVIYSDGTEIDIHIDEIIGESMAGEDLLEALERGYVGDGGRTFPERMNPYTTPRLWAAKQDAVKEMVEYNVEWMKQMGAALIFLITVPMGGGRARAVRRPTPRRITRITAGRGGSTRGTMAAGGRATLRFLEGEAPTGSRTILVDTASGRVFVGGPQQIIHEQVFEAAGLENYVGVVGGFGRFLGGRLLTFELSSGVFMGTQAEIELAMSILRALAGG
jgi:hypothetical protein